MVKMKSKTVVELNWLNDVQISTSIFEKLKTYQNVTFINSDVIETFMKRPTAKTLRNVANISNDWDLLIILINNENHWSFAVYYKRLSGIIIKDFIHYDSKITTTTSYNHNYFEKIVYNLIDQKIVDDCRISLTTHWVSQIGNWECGYCSHYGIIKTIRRKPRLLIAKKNFKNNVSAFIIRKYYRYF